MDVTRFWPDVVSVRKPVRCRRSGRRPSRAASLPWRMKQIERPVAWASLRRDPSHLDILASTVTSRCRPIRACRPPRSAARASLLRWGRRCSVLDVAAMLHGRKASKIRDTEGVGRWWPLLAIAARLCRGKKMTRHHLEARLMREKRPISRSRSTAHRLWRAPRSHRGDVEPSERKPRWPGRDLSKA
jgi:hypothetical protein